MKCKKNRIFDPMMLAARVIIIVCFVFFVVTLFRFGVKNILIDSEKFDSECFEELVTLAYSDNPGAEVKTTNKININWKELYPFDTVSNDVKHEVLPKKDVNKLEIISNRILGKVETVKEKINFYFDTGLYMRNFLLETGTVVTDVLCWDLPESGKKNSHIFWDGKEGHVTKCIDKVNVDEGAQSLSEFAEWVEQKNINFLYIQYPAKMSGVEKHMLPDDVNTYVDENSDALVEILDKNNVSYLDIREELMPEGAENMFDLFFRTDHHWLPQTGVKVAGVIAQNINKMTDTEMEEDILDTDRYNVEIYENIFLGSYGREVTAALILPDDFPIVTPDFDTSLSISIPDLGITKTGSFEETLLDMNMLYQKPSYLLAQYSVYCYGDRPVIEITNHLAENDSKVLLVKDSFSNVVSPYLALAVEELAIIDLRHFTGSLRTYIEEYNPDSVIVAYNANAVSEADSIKWNTHESFWDFR